MHNYGSNILCFDTNSLIFHFRFDYFRKRDDCELIYFSLMQTLCWHFLVLEKCWTKEQWKAFFREQDFFFHNWMIFICIENNFVILEFWSIFNFWSIFEFCSMISWFILVQFWPFVKCKRPTTWLSELTKNK